MVKVEIVLDNSRIFLFPASVALGSETNAIPPDDTTVRGEVVLTSEEYVRIGPVRVVWEVARELKGKNTWEKRDVLARFESEVIMDDSYLEQGETRYVLLSEIKILLIIPVTCSHSKSPPSSLQQPKQLSIGHHIPS